MVGLDQQDLSARAGVSRVMISDFERGTRTPSVEHIFRICQGAGLNPAWVITGAGEPLAEMSDQGREARRTIVGLPLEESTKNYYLSRLDSLGCSIRRLDDLLQEAKFRSQVI